MLVCNSFYWVLFRWFGFIVFNIIIRFDFVVEEFEIFIFFEFFVYENIDIGVFEGCFCLMCNCEFIFVDVWVMKEYKVEGFWSKVFSVLKLKSVEFFDFMRFLFYFKDRRKVLIEVNNVKFLWFDLESKRLRMFRIKDCDSLYSVELFVSSFVLGCKGDFSEVKRRREC